MRLRIAWLLFVLVLMIAASTTVVCTGCETSFSSGGETPSSSGGVDLASIPLEDALSSGRPTLAVFVGPTCACNNITPVFEELAAEHGSKLNVVIVDITEEKGLAGQHEVVMIPTLIIFDGNGEEMTRHIGALPKEAIVSQLESMGML